MICSVVVIAALYLTMNVAILGVVPWQSIVADVESGKEVAIGAVFMERLYGRGTALGLTALILWTAMAATFVLTLGYSRVLYAAARNGDFFRVFGRLHPVGQYPLVAILTLGALTAAFCFFSLQGVIEAAVIVRIFVQFLGQIIGLHLLRKTRPDVALPFRMWFYPIPSAIALVGWLFIVIAQYEYLLAALAVFVSGALVYPLWRRWVAVANAVPGESTETV